MKPKTAAASALPRTATPAAVRNRPRPVFSRDDAAARGTAPDEPLSVLIVEDDFLIAMQIESVLTDAGIPVAGIASSVEEALQHAERAKPGLAIMDIRLRGRRDGIDCAIELFVKHGIRCIFATAHQNAQARERALPARPVAWLGKPYSMESLLSAVRQALRETQDKEN